MIDRVKIRGARVHNLKNIDVDVPLNRIVGIAGATQDCAVMWQIGVDVEPGQRGRGISAVLVRLLKNEILKRGKIPFYATSQSHILSMDTAVSAGFLPAWSEIYVYLGKY